MNLDRSRLRLIVVQALVLSLMATLFGRLAYLQLVDGSSYSQAAASNRVREVITPAARGPIVDDVGRPLVRNRTSMVVSLNRALLPAKKADQSAMLDRLAAVLGTTRADLDSKITPCVKNGPRPCYNGSPYQPIPVHEDATDAMTLAIQEHREQYPGVTVEPQAVPEYPQQDLAAQLLGYLSPISQSELDHAKKEGKDLSRLANSQVGRAGLEATYDQYLQGKPGVQRLAVDSKSTVEGVLSQTPPTSGDTLVLNLDAKIQRATQDSLVQAIQSARGQIHTGTKNDPLNGQHYLANSGAMVVMNADTGAVVAMASYPTYDPGVWVGGISQSDYATLTSDASGQPLLDRAIQGQYAPGSTYKLVTAAAAVKDGYSTDGVYPCPGAFEIAGHLKNNFEGEALGNISLRTAIIKSCDTVFYKFGVEEWQRDEARLKNGQQPTEPMAAMSKAFGIGSPTGVDLPSEAAGRIPDRAWKQAYWKATKVNLCKRAQTGYPEIASTDPVHAAYLKAIAEENCKYGYVYLPGDAANFAVGQGDVLVTPLQLTRAYAALANGGTLYTPQIAKAVIAPDGSVIQRMTPHVDGKLPVDQATLDYIRSSMMAVTGKDGTASAAYGSFPLAQIPVGGKTGTAQVANKFDTSWFASFVEKPGSPRYVVVGMMTQAGTGGTAAAPATASVYDAIYGVGAPSVAPVAGGNLPTALPTVQPDGTITAPPGTLAAAADGSGTTTTSGTAAAPAAAPPAGPAVAPAAYTSAAPLPPPRPSLPDSRPPAGTERAVATRRRRRTGQRPC